jgi:hypothetical protein
MNRTRTALLTAGLLILGTLLSGPTQRAAAQDLPSWAEPQTNQKAGTTEPGRKHPATDQSRGNETRQKFTKPRSSSANDLGGAQADGGLPPPGGGSNDPTQAPVDGGIGLLAAAGAAYAYRRLNDSQDT